MKLNRIIFLGALCGLLVLQAQAQETQTVRIENGTVTINGEVVPADELPDGLDTEGMTAHLSYTGDDEAVFQIDGRFYAVEGNRLVERDAEDVSDEAISVFFRDGMGPRFTPLPERIAFRDQAPGAAVAFSERSNPLIAFKGQTDALRAQSEALLEQSEDLIAQAEDLARAAEERADEGDEVDPALQRQVQTLRERAASLAAEARALQDRSAATVLALPRVQVYDYFGDVQRQNHELFEQLQRERQLDMEARALALRIRRLEEGSDEREALVEDLRNMLSEIFALKEANRRREVEELEAELDKLEESLEKRAANREAIIDRRLNELLGEYDW